MGAVSAPPLPRVGDGVDAEVSHWHGTDVDAEAVDAALAELRRLHAGGAPVGGVRNVLALPGTDAPFLAALAHAHAARMLILESDPDADSGFDASASLHVHVRGGARIAFERVVLRLSGGAARHAESAVLSLLLPGVPLYLAGRVPGQAPWLHRLAGHAYRLITDAGGADPLRPWLTVVPTIDAAWARLDPWRKAVSAAFDARGRGLPRLAEAAATVHGRGFEADLLAAWWEDRTGVMARHARDSANLSGLDVSGPDVELTVRAVEAGVQAHLRVAGTERTGVIDGRSVAGDAAITSLLEGSGRNARFEAALTLLP